jgi:hypothetical protein
MIPRPLLMCRRHWFMIPHDLQERVITTLREWEQGGSVRPYVLVVAEAQLAVAQKENLPAEFLAPIEADVAKFGGKLHA